MSGHQLLRASAGTGKTYRLVEAYAAQVMQGGLRPGEIIGITFTRKAALELKLRIRERLKKAGAAPALLTELGRAPLSNFHGLALQMLRTWGVQAGFTPATEVLGDAGADRALFVQACEDAWFGGTPEAAQAVQRLAPHVTVDLQLPDALWEVIGRAREDGRSIDAALVGTYDGPAAQAAGHAQLLALRQQLSGAVVTGKGKDKLALFLAAPLPAADAPLDSWTAQWRAALGHLDRRGTLGKVFSEDDQKMIETALEGARAEQVCHALAPALGALLQDAWQAYGAAKLQRQAMDFADIIERVVQVLETRPHLHTAVRERFRAVLVDEAQDTNRLQRHLIDLLAGLRGPAAETTRPAQLFVVGDWKQSIYTFRGANPQSFNQFAADLRQRGGTEETLSVSRRSTPAVVRSVNHLGDALFGVQYEALAPLHADPTPGAPGMTWCVLPEAGPEVSTAWHEAQGVAAQVRARLEEGAHPGDFAVLMATMTCAPLVARALADRGVPAVLGGGGGLYEQSEVVDVLALLTWLCERRARLAAAVALRAPLIGISDASLLAVAARGAQGLESLWRGQMPEASLHPADAGALQSVAAHMPTWVRLARGDSAVAVLEALDGVLHLRAVTLAQPNGEQRLANLHRLFALARAAEGQPVARFVRQQNERMRQGHAEPIVPLPAAERRAVTLSSVHQSKGLQYPVVVLAGVARKGRNDTASLRYSREHGLVMRPRVGHESLKTARWRSSAEAEAEAQAQEMRRLLYVAITRAQREILVVAPEPDTVGKDGFSRLLAPWAAPAVQAGVLHLARGEAPPLPPWQPIPESAQPLLALDNRAPAGTHFEITVTQLAHWEAESAQPAAPHADAPPPSTAWRPQAPDPGALDPMTRGSLAHAVLAALERHAEAPDTDAFIVNELRRAGYDPNDPALTEVRADLRAFLGSRLGAALLRLPAESRRPELPFALPVAAAPYTACLRGKLDLLVWDAEGPVIVDYKHARQNDAHLAPYLAQLEAYAWAVMQLCQVRTPVRTRLVFLRDHAATPLQHVVTPEMAASLQTRLQAWVSTQAQWPSAALPLSPTVPTITA